MKGTFKLAYRCPACGECSWEKTRLCWSCGHYGTEFKEIIFEKDRHTFPLRPWTWKDRWSGWVLPLPEVVAEKKKGKK